MEEITWLDDPENDTTDPQDGGEPFVYWWEDMRPYEVCALVKEAYERGRQSQTNAVSLGRYKRTEEIKDLLQKYYTVLVPAINKATGNSLEDLLRVAQRIQDIITTAARASDARLQAQGKRKKSG